MLGSKTVDCLVIGAGISGLAVAWRLHQQAPDRSVAVIETSDRVGGNITTQTNDDFLWEEGPTSFAPNPALLELIAELNLNDQICRGDRYLPRYIYWQQKLHPLEPTRPLSLITSGLLSPWGKLRAGLGAVGFVPPRLTTGDESVTDFFQRHLGQEVLERLVAPFVSGVYAGDPAQLSAAAAFRRIVQLEGLGGGLVPGALRLRKTRKSHPSPQANPRLTKLSLAKMRPGELGSFQGGLKTLPTAIASHLGDLIHLGVRATAITPLEAGGFNVTLEDSHQDSEPQSEGSHHIHAHRVVLAIPANGVAALLRPHAPLLSDALNTIPYPGVACVVFAYPDVAILPRRPGFGHLIPRNQGIRTLGTIWSSCLFPGRTPPGWQMFTSFIGGATDPHLIHESTEAIADIVKHDLHKVLGLDISQGRLLSVKRWSRAIPQYTLGYDQQLQAIQTGLKQMPGLFLCSNYIGGVALGDRVQQGNAIAVQVQDSWCSLSS